MAYNKIMVIDDSHFDRLIARKVIEVSQLAENIILAASVLEAISYLESVEKTGFPEIILLDISMPELDGFDFLQRFDKMPENNKMGCKIVMLSSSIDPNDINRAKKCKYVHGFISKPLTVEKLKCYL